MDSENEDSSDLEVESVSSNEEEVLETMAETLEQQIGQNVYLYHIHIDLITVLKQLGDMERLRTARSRMSDHFPLTTELWLEWLNDEIKVAVTHNEKKIVLELFDKAVKDYLSVELWMKYLEFASETYGYEDEANVSEVRKICEQSLTSAGLHVAKASALWNFYITYEKLVLIRIKNNPDLHLNQLKLIANLYKRMLSCPLINMDRAYYDFSSWLNEQKEHKDKIIDKVVVDNIYKASKEKLVKIKEYEEALISDRPNAVQHYKNYIEHEKTKAGSPVRVQYLYERLMSEFCLDEELWVEYINYVSTVLKNGDVVLGVVQRSLRNCLWSCTLHQLHILSLEKYDHSHKEITGAFEQAVASGLQVAENFRDLWMTYLEYLRRRYDAPEISKEEEDKRLVELRAAFEKAVDFLSQLQDSDPECQVMQYWARIEANHCRNMEKCRLLWTNILSNYNLKTSDMWLEYINIERAFGDSKHLRKLLVRALQSTRDFPEKVAKYWMNYERDEGTLESYQDCLDKIESRLNQIREQRERDEARRLAEREAYKKKLKKGNAPPESQSEVDANKSQGIKRKQDEPGGSEQPAKKKSPLDMEYLEKLYQESCKEEAEKEAEDSSKENRTIFVSNLGHAGTESLIREIFEPCGKITDLRVVKDYRGLPRGYSFVEFEKKSSALAGLKKDREIVNGRPIFVSQCDPNHEPKDKGIRYSSGLEKNKLFIRGLPFEIGESKLREIYGPFGSLKGVRLVTYRNGRPKGLAYVEYKDEISAAKALLATNGMLVGDRSINVAISNPPERTEGTRFAHFLRETSGGSTPRKTGRKQLSFVPRSVQLKASGHVEPGTSSSVVSQPAEPGTSSSVVSPQPGTSSSVESPLPVEQPKKMSNADFRSLLNK